MASFAALEARTKAAEHFFIAREEQHALLRHVQRLVDQGKAPASMLSKLQDNLARATTHSQHTVPAAFADVPTTVNTKPSGYIYQHVQRGISLPPPPKGAEAYMGMGSAVSFGRGRWNAHGASIFSVQDGKRLAQTPVKETMVPWEQARHAKIVAASRETPLLFGYRVLPELTPGRAFLWGSVLALWGTALTVKLAAANMGIHSAEDAPGVLRAVIQPYAHALAARMQPLKNVLPSVAAGAVDREAVSASDFARSLRRQLG